MAGTYDDKELVVHRSGTANPHRTAKPMKRLATYSPSAYEPVPVCYGDILYRVVHGPVDRTNGILKQLRKALQPCRTEQIPLQPGEAPPPLELVLERCLFNLANASEQIQAALSAVTKDVSNNAVPKVATHEFAAIRTHHLGRWYAKALALEAERFRIQSYLGIVAENTQKARRIIGYHHVKSVTRSLAVQKADVTKAIYQYRREFEAAVYAMVCELKAARLAQQWHKAWTLERKLASTATTFLPSRPLIITCRFLSDRDDAGVTEISMSRLAEWNDSYEELYKEDVYIRKRMNLVKSYWKVFSNTVHEKPWQGEAVTFTARSPTSDAKEVIVIRHDQSSPPSLLWPRAWGQLQIRRPLLD
ncbi:hypothetical protein UCDDA912_g01300 [Diaporthe ampelina]|uniref:Uncharacterized protein n=1 Tax=Diaporthe ampelina TaxID=1214573 RepID=A0A0G2FWW7_9PEZI|nr:hypothetical protein UCDDA912_g01300 [Diaporthe ampelina]